MQSISNGDTKMTLDKILHPNYINLLDDYERQGYLFGKQTQPNLIRVSTNLQWTNKPEEKVVNGRKGWYHKNTLVNLAAQWEPFEGTVKELFDLLTVDGAPVCAVLKDNYRNTANFQTHSVLMIDIDYGMTIQQLLAHPFYQQYGTGYYVTPSHTETNHRFRVFFRLEEDVASAEAMQCLYTSALTELGGDKQCKDASRYFNGTKDCLIKELNETKFLPTAVAKRLISSYQTSLYKPAATPTNYTAPTDAERALYVSMLSKIKLNSGNESAYNTWLGLAHAFKAEGFTVEDFITATNEKDVLGTKQKWKTLNNNESGVGTIINVLKQHYGADYVKSKLWLAREEALENSEIESRKSAWRKKLSL